MPYLVICPHCKGTGNDINIAIGLGQERLEPAYVMNVCPVCRGSKWVDGVGVGGDGLHHPDIPDSYLWELYKRWRAKKQQKKT